ncbi:MAG: glycosyltransferase, partial [Ignavibacteriales bacterium]
GGQVAWEGQARQGGKTIYYLVHCFYPFSQGGTERFVFNMAKQAQLNGNRVKVITYNATELSGHFKNRVGPVLFNEYELDGINVLEYRHIKAPRGILKDIVVEDPAVLKFAEFLFEREKPDILHVAYFQKTSGFFAACRKRGSPYGITLTSFYAMCHYDIMIDRQGRLCSGCEKGEKCRRDCRCLDVVDPSQRYQNMYRIFREAAFITAPSIFVKNMVEREFAGISVRVINHGVSRDFLSQDRAPSDQTDEGKKFAYFGSLSPIKGVHGLITAFKELSLDNRLEIFGAGSEQYLKMLKRLSEGRDNIIFKGSVRYNEIGKAYRGTDIVVVPSIWYETYNFVIHEALLMNRIVIAARIGAMPERIREGVTGYTFCPGDWTDLRKTMEKALQNGLPPNAGLDLFINTVEAEFAQYNWLYEQALVG